MGLRCELILVGFRRVWLRRFGECGSGQQWFGKCGLFWDLILVGVI